MITKRTINELFEWKELVFGEWITRFGCGDNIFHRYTQVTETRYGIGQWTSTVKVLSS